MGLLTQVVDHSADYIAGSDERFQRYLGREITAARGRVIELYVAGVVALVFDGIFAAPGPWGSVDHGQFGEDIEAALEVGVHTLGIADAAAHPFGVDSRYTGVAGHGQG